MTRVRTALLVGTALAVTSVPAANAAQWSGFYAGGNFGYSWGGLVTANTTPFTVVFNVRFDPFVVPGDTFGLRPNGIIGGGQFGYNWQLGVWVFGFESDFQASDQHDRIQRTRYFFDIDCSDTCDAISDTDISARLSWFGTTRARVGQDFNGLLGYVTGGAAYGHVKVSGSDTISVDAEQDGDIDAVFFRPFSASETLFGWTVGGGIEGQMLPPFNTWTWRVEYLFIDFGTLEYNDGTAIVSTRVTDHIVRFAINVLLPVAPP